MIFDIKDALLLIEHETALVPDLTLIKAWVNDPSPNPVPTVHKWYFERLLFAAPHEIIGLFMLKNSGRNELTYFGYRCGDCRKIILIPEDISVRGFTHVLQHKCEVI